MTGAPDATLAVLDLGKTNVKLALFSGNDVVWQRGMPNRVLPGPPYPHADVEAIWYPIAPLPMASFDDGMPNSIPTAAEHSPDSTRITMKFSSGSRTAKL